MIGCSLVQQHELLVDFVDAGDLFEPLIDQAPRLIVANRRLLESSLELIDGQLVAESRTAEI